MKTLTAIMLAALLGTTAAGSGVPRSKAEITLAASKNATGGTAWDKVQGCHEEGSHGDGAIRYTTRFRLDDYGMRVDSERDGKARAMGFNGIAPWQSSEGQTAVASDPGSRSEAILTAYLSNNGFFFPDRFPASYRYLRKASEGGHRYDVLEIAPKGSRPVEIWFDRASHLIRRVVDAQGTPPTRVDADEYRAVGGFMIATRLTIFGPDGAVVDHGAVTAFRCGTVDATIFDPPQRN